MINFIKKIIWGMYFIKFFGILCFLVFGLLLRIIIFLEFICNFLIIYFSNVVFLYLLGFRSLYLKYINKSLWIYLMFRGL